MLIQNNNAYNDLISKIGLILNEGREKAGIAINTILVSTYWEIGKHIVEYEQDGKEKAEYGSQLLNRLSRDLTEKHGKGFGRSNVQYMRKLYVAFPKSGTLSRNLGWSHYYEILKLDDELEQSFYIRQVEHDNWSIRELKRQIKSMLFQRLAVSKDKEGIIQLSKQGHIVQTPDDLIKDPFVLEFLKIPIREQYLEGDLEQKLIDNLQHFLLELGKGFAFMARQYRISLGGKHYHVDLLFYHRILKCFVLIDLKRGEIDHLDIGQMNLYLNYFKKEENTEGDNEPIGIILGATKNEILVEYATASIDNQILLSKYQLYLPNRTELQREIEKILNQD